LLLLFLFPPLTLSMAVSEPFSFPLSFAAQFLSLRYLMQNKGALQPQVLQVPSEVDEEVARIKLDSLGIKIDQLTESQKEYLSRW